MQFDFDQEFNKIGLHNSKWESYPENGKHIYSDQADPKYGAERVLPLGRCERGAR